MWRQTGRTAPTRRRTRRTRSSRGSGRSRPRPTRRRRRCAGWHRGRAERRTPRGRGGFLLVGVRSPDLPNSTSTTAWAVIARDNGDRLNMRRAKVENAPWNTGAPWMRLVTKLQRLRGQDGWGCPHGRPPPRRSLAWNMPEHVARCPQPGTVEHFAEPEVTGSPPIPPAGIEPAQRHRVAAERRC